MQLVIAVVSVDPRHEAAGFAVADVRVLHAWLGEYPSLGKHHEKLMARAAFADTVPAAPK